MDIFLQRKDYIKNLKMSKDEVKREYKEDEGDPHIKSHRRQMHMEMAMGDVRGKMKNADAIEGRAPGPAQGSAFIAPARWKDLKTQEGTPIPRLFPLR